jgi:glycosyltransferase involved in cell wall biosynthesis
MVLGCNDAVAMAWALLRVFPFMRIAQVSPLHESVPPKLYGGTERIVSYVTEELVRLGHDVTLFASGDSGTRARLVAPCRRALRLDPTCLDPLAMHMVMLDQVARQAADFDIIHYHIDYLHFPVSRRLRVPHVTTLHGRLDLPDLQPLYEEFSDMPVVSISDAQRGPLPQARWVGTVHHGLPVDSYPFNREPGTYLAFLGRITPEKRVDRAIQIARRTGIPLRIAAKIEPLHGDYFEAAVRPFLDDPLVDFIGEIGEADKGEFLANACALLFPIDWPEPFGLAMTESMACGTPVIAWRHGSVSEIVDEGVTGLTVDSVAGAVAAVERVTALDRAACRATCVRRFSVERMVAEYLGVYGRVRDRATIRRLPIALSASDPISAVRSAASTGLAAKSS